MVVKIWQLPDTKYLDFEELGEEFDIKKYNCVYTTNESIDTTLDDIFYKFNHRRPEDFTGRSISVSDIVEMNEDLYYCNNMGWKKVEK